MKRAPRRMAEARKRQADQDAGRRRLLPHHRFCQTQSGEGSDSLYCLGDGYKRSQSTPHRAKAPVS
jgi:hypothetical protein